MTMTVFRLLIIHRRLDDEIRTQAKRLWPDLMRIQKLKKARLAVKDRLHRVALGRGRRHAV
jgi:hypothetical protein